MKPTLKYVEESMLEVGLAGTTILEGIAFPCLGVWTLWAAVGG
jgi:hypothetical protein